MHPSLKRQEQPRQQRTQEEQICSSLMSSTSPTKNKNYILYIIQRMAERYLILNDVLVNLFREYHKSIKILSWCFLPRIYSHRQVQDRR